MYYTYYGANSWLLELGDRRILVDPWLVDSLIFFNMPWLFKGDRPQPIDPRPDRIDLILLSQGLEDHAHRPTLNQLDRTIPVIASPTAAKVAQELDYTTITTLSPGDSHMVGDRLQVQALSGAPIGLQMENGYCLTDTHQDFSVYYEPHGYPPSTLDTMGQVEVVISPVVNLELPFSIPIIQGNDSALALAQQLKPFLFLPTALGGDVVYSGMLDKLIQTTGDVNKLQQRLTEAHLSTQVMAPTPYQRYSAVVTA
ncbi:MAG: MBL fold metallo-hydrolase [Cyanothece sp. SIO2G6]|nr:MBL fold metallo-hydrolase [Cyanothece sp. SIO2G6]